MKKLLLGTFIFVFVFLLVSYSNPNSSFALSCAEIPKVEDAYEKYDGVIIAQVDEVIRKRDHNEVRLTVNKSFKGIEEGKISITEDMTWGNLNGPSEAGEEYLFFLKVNSGKWENPLCSPTVKVSAASEELEFLKDKELLLEHDVVPTESPSESMGDKKIPSNDEREHNVSLTVIVILAVILIGIMIYVFTRKRLKR